MKTLDALGDTDIYLEQPCISMESCIKLQQHVSMLLMSVKYRIVLVSCEQGCTQLHASTEVRNFNSFSMFVLRPRQLNLTTRLFTLAHYRPVMLSALY